MTFENTANPPLYELLEQDGYLDPVRARRIFLMLVREHFSDPLNYLDASIASLYYSKDNSRTLDVELDFTYDSEDIGKKPVIYVGTGPYRFKKQAIGNYEDASYDNSTTQTTTECLTNVFIRHISTSSDLSLSLASQTSQFLGSVRDLLWNEVPGILVYEVSELTPPTLIDPEKVKVFQSNVNVTLGFNMTWISRIESLRIKEILFHPDVRSGI